MFFLRRIGGGIEMGIGQNKHIRKEYELCAMRGMTVLQTAQYFGVSQDTVRVMASRCGIKFAIGSGKDRRSTVSSAGMPASFSGLTSDQVRDVDTLMKKGGYSQRDAVRIVMAPRVKIRLGRPPERPDSPQEPQS